LKVENILPNLYKLGHRHTANNVKEMVLYVLKDWKIPLSKISGITTDNGTNMIKAVQLYWTYFMLAALGKL